MNNRAALTGFFAVSFLALVIANDIGCRHRSIVVHQDFVALQHDGSAGRERPVDVVPGDLIPRWANVVRALDICKGSGVQQPYLDTVLGE